MKTSPPHPRRKESAMDPTEYQAKREWPRINPHGMRAQAVRREVRAYERELQARGETVDDPMQTPRTLSRGYVAYWPDRPDQPLGSNVVHADPHCWQIDTWPSAGCARPPRP